MKRRTANAPATAVSQLAVNFVGWSFAVLLEAAAAAGSSTDDD
jgi:hypothetical protein